MLSWWSALRRRLRDRQEHRALERRAIADPLWDTTLAGLPFLHRLTLDERAGLRRLCSLFLDSKQFHGAGGLVITDEMALCVAMQACLPVLHLGLAGYAGFVGIVMQHDEVVAHRRVADDDAVVHEYDEPLTGEAMQGGPVMLSWADVRGAANTAALSYNVVIHEFAHVLDMAHGGANGMPALPNAAARERWSEVFDASYRRFCRRVDRGVATVLDPYGATAPEEFFAVAVEAFFVNARAFKAENPALYAVLADYFRQDPAA